MKQRERITIALCLIGLLVGSTCALGAVVSYSGMVSRAAGFGAVGTFKPGFDPHTYAKVYGDFGGNLFGDVGYGQAVADGNFRPIASGPWSGNTFSGSGTASGIEGQRLWLFLFDNTNPGDLSYLAMATGSDGSWLGPADGGSTTVLGNSANSFVFGGGGNGGPIILNVAPFPEPTGVGVVGLIAVTLLRRKAR
jgi:hypothetical protein